MSFNVTRNNITSPFSSLIGPTWNSNHTGVPGKWTNKRIHILRDNALKGVVTYWNLKGKKGKFFVTKNKNQSQNSKQKDAIWWKSLEIEYANSVRSGLVHTQPDIFQKRHYFLRFSFPSTIKRRRHSGAPKTRDFRPQGDGRNRRISNTTSYSTRPVGDAIVSASF